MKSAREAAGLTQDALAKRAHCGQTTIASIENGRNEGATPLPMLAHVLGVEALWLAEGKGPRRREGCRALHDATANELLMPSFVKLRKPWTIRRLGHYFTDSNLLRKRLKINSFVV